MQLNNDYKILVAITNFHNPNRTKYLDKVLQNLQNFVITTDVIVVTNIDRKLEFGRTRCYDVSKDPFSLTWKHKELWIEYQNDYTHFIYMEDDLGFEYSNFQYWLEFRERLRYQGLRPGMVRYEFNKKKEKWGTDYFHDVSLLKNKIIDSDPKFYATPYFYHAMYIMDQELLQEHLKGPFMYCDKSLEKLISMGISPFKFKERERAALGPAMDNVPTGYPSRYVVPLDKDGKISDICHIHHMPENYVNRWNYCKFLLDKTVI